MMPNKIQPREYSRGGVTEGFLHIRGQRQPALPQCQSQ
jgi:hypothetical protein